MGALSLAALAAVTATLTLVAILIAAAPEPAAAPSPGPTARATATPAPPQPSPPPGWTLAWNDEFNGSVVDRSSWAVEHASTFGDGNNELACLMDRPSNVSVADGALTITARREQTLLRCGSTDRRFPDGRMYSSAMLSSRDKRAFEYGRFEIRARTPTAQGTSKGLWPAFWLRPSTGLIGELDILEILGTGAADPYGANRIYQTIQYDYEPTYPQQTRAYTLPTGTFSDGYHDFAVEWEPGSISWFVDGVLSYRRDAATTPWLEKAFVGDFYLRLNLAVGGDWPGSPDADTSFPARFQVDYVRVYRR